VAAGIASTSRQIGQTLGVAVVGAIVTSGIHGIGPYRPGGCGSHPGWWILVRVRMVLVFLGWVATSSWALESARRTAAAINPEVLVGSCLTTRAVRCPSITKYPTIVLDVVEGSGRTATRKLHEVAQSVRVVKAGTAYGPLKDRSESGCTSRS
jgi:hypothetical protein